MKIPMNRLILFTIICLFPFQAMSNPIQNKIAGIKIMIETATQKNTELKTLLSQKESEIRDLKFNLKQVEDKIAVLK